jgi:hypothetical protein
LTASRANSTPISPSTKVMISSKSTMRLLPKSQVPELLHQRAPGDEADIRKLQSMFVLKPHNELSRFNFASSMLTDSVNDRDTEIDIDTSEQQLDLVTPAKKAVKAVTRSTRKVAKAVDAALDSEPVHPLSPSQLARSIPVKNFSVDKVGNAVSEWFSTAAKTTGFWEHVDFTRETLSDPKAIHAIIASYEFAWLTHDLVPWTTVSVSFRSVY